MQNRNGNRNGQGQGNCHCCNKKLNNCSWKDKFSDKGLKFTIPRQEIIRIMQKNDKSLSADEVYSHIHKVAPEIGIATVYRTLDLLTKMGFLLKFDSSDKISRFQLRGKSHNHFLECVKCGNLIEYTSEITEEEKKLLSIEEEKLEKKYKFQINYHIVKFYGFCPECKE
ncbi:MAG: transcriptional repressor [Candidatus Muiribacteriota bacterium]